MRSASSGKVVEILRTSIGWSGVGGFARKRAEEALVAMDIKIGTILHPSPASPAANRGWAEAATKQMLDQKIWVIKKEALQRMRALPILTYYI